MFERRFTASNVKRSGKPNSIWNGRGGAIVARREFGIVSGNPM
jgi:hypothetical protein